MSGGVYLGLLRPQYVSVPEGFLAALAGSAFDVDFGVDPGGKALAVAYELKAAGRTSATLKYHETRPRKAADLDKFGAALKAAGLESADDQRQLAEAVAAGIAGSRPRDGKVRATIPITASLALAQNLSGLVGSKNPPNVAAILEQLFELGAPAGSEGDPGAAMLWVRAAEHRSAVDPVVRAIDDAVGTSFFSSRPQHSGGKRIQEASDNFQDTPYAWFHQAWTKLCRPDWVTALPARVWVDWANTVLRLAFGLGYLWEVAWYEAVARSVVSGGSHTVGELKKEVGELLPWKDPSAAVSVRDVAASTKWRVMRSNGVREAIRNWINASEETGDAVGLDAMQGDPDFRAKLTTALTDPSGTNQNLWEAINYSLLTREGTGANADHYGFLRKDHGPRFSLPDPGVEWLAALASLSCPGPGGSSDVGQFLKNLRLLGLRPEMGDLVNRLEHAGVARGSADADQAVEIRAAF